MRGSSGGMSGAVQPSQYCAARFKVTLRALLAYQIGSGFSGRGLMPTRSRWWNFVWWVKVCSVQRRLRRTKGFIFSVRVIPLLV